MSDLLVGVYSQRRKGVVGQLRGSFGGPTRRATVIAANRPSALGTAGARLVYRALTDSAVPESLEASGAASAFRDESQIR